MNGRFAYKTCQKPKKQNTMENKSRLRMGNTCIFQLCCLVFFAYGTLAMPADLSSTIGSQDFPPRPRASLFVFGDSLYDAGINNYINTTLFKANFLPYGETFFEFSTGRFCDGRVIPDFIAKFAKLPLIPPYFMSGYRQFPYGVNFASGGSGALDETNQGQVIALNMQLIYFKDVIQQLRTRTLGVKKTKELLRNAVYMFSVGNNDLVSPNPIFSSLSSEEYIKMVVGNFSAVIKEVYKAGGRKFGFINLFKLGCAPYNRVQILGRTDGDVCAEGNVTSLGIQYNAALSKEIKRLQKKQIKGFMYSKFDFFTAGLQRIRNPSQYGFSEVRSACCGSGVDRSRFSCGGKRGEPDYELCKNPDQYFFFDAFHPSEKADQQFAELMWDGPSTLTAPYTLKSLFQLSA